MLGIGDEETKLQHPANRQGSGTYHTAGDLGGHYATLPPFAQNTGMVLLGDTTP